MFCNLRCFIVFTNVFFKNWIVRYRYTQTLLSFVKIAKHTMNGEGFEPLLFLSSCITHYEWGKGVLNHSCFYEVV